MGRSGRFIKALAVAAFGVGLASCANLQGPKPVCPETAILAGTDEINIYKPGRGRDLTDIEFTARFVEASNKCSYDEDDRLLTVDNRFTIIAERGPAAKNFQVEFPIYVALTRTNKQMIDKRQYPVLVRFPEGVDRMEVHEGVNGTKIFLEKGEKGDHFEILVGFQLSRSQLDQNRN